MSVGIPLGYTGLPVASGFATPVAAGGFHPTVPGVPTAVAANPGNASAVVSFLPPVNTGGSPIVSYTATSSPGGFTASGSASPLTVTGLTNGTSYTFTVTATNAVGTGAASTASNAVTPATVPGIPTIGTAIPFNGYATVAFAANGNGGSPITAYTALSTPGGITAAGTSNPITVPGLSSTTTYTFQVLATNAIGSSQYSGPSNGVEPGPPNTVPGAPTSVVGFPDSGQVVLTFTAPSSGGSAITGYTATSVPGGIQGMSAASPLTVTGLTNGTAYTFTVTATNSVGTGPASAPSAAVTPSTIPGAPTSPVATRGNASASVAFTAPSSNGGSAITAYTVTGSPGGARASGTASPIVVSGLTNGSAYTFSVTATNANGTGAPSAASNVVTPATVPTAPTSPAASAGNAQAAVSFTPPSSNGGSPIVSYTATSSPGGFTASGSASPLTVTGLTNGTSYTFTVTATNAVGTGAASTATSPVTPTTFIISNTSLPAGLVGTPYSATIGYSGGVLPITTANTSGGLPAGLSLNPITGVISGAPTAAGTTSSVFQGTDSSGTVTSTTVADNEGPGAVQTPGGLQTVSSVALLVGAPVVALTTVATYGGAHAPPGLQTTAGDTIVLQTSVAGPQSTAAGAPINASQETAMFTIAGAKGGTTTFQQWYGGAGYGGTNPGDQDYPAFKAYQYASGNVIVGIGAFTATTGTAYAGVAKNTAITSGSITLTSAQVPCTLYGFCENTSSLGTNFIATPNTVGGVAGTIIEETWGFGGGTPDNTSCYASWPVTAAGTYTPSFNQNSTTLNCFQTVGWAVQASSASDAQTPTKTLPITITGSAPAVNTFSVSGNESLVSGVAKQMRGWNLDGLEYVFVQNNSPATWGGIKPNYPYYKTWNPNYSRIPINGDSWLGNTTYNGAGGSYNILTATATSATLGASVTLDSVPGSGATTATVTGYNSVLGGGGTFPIVFGDSETRTATVTVTYSPIVYHFTWSPGLSSAQSTAAITITQNWPLATQPALGTFADVEQRTITCTNGSNAISWTGSLTTIPSVGSQIDLFVWGAAVNCDPDGNCRAVVLQAIADAQSIGTTPEVDLHWQGPLMSILGQTRILTCNYQQPPYAPAAAIELWESVCSVLGSNVPGTTVTLTAGGTWTIDNTNIAFGYMNEPFLDTYSYALSAGTADLALLNGGTSGKYPNGSGGPFNVQATWSMAGTAAGLSAIRGTGATNVVLFGGNSYAQNVKNCKNWIPTDTLSPAQTGAYVHYYPNTYNGANPYPYTAYYPGPLVGSDSGYAAPSASDWQYITNVRAAGTFVICNECGDAWAGSASSSYAEVNADGAPALALLQTKADAIGFGVVPFCFNPPQTTSSAVIDIPPVQGTQGTFSSQTPLAGMGVVSYDWMEPHP